MNHAIELERVTKRFGNCLAVDQLDLVVPEGSIYGFIGPNGSGKTTTLRMILRILYPDSGRVTVLGCDRGSARQRPRRLSARRTGAVPEDARAGVAAVLRPIEGHAPLRSGNRRLAGTLRPGPLGEAKGRGISKGMAQKVQFIAAIVAKPRLLVLDEPFTGLDPVDTDVLLDAVRSGPSTRDDRHLFDPRHGRSRAAVRHHFMIFRGKKVLDGTLAAIQAQFGEDTIRLRTSDADSRWPICRA